MTGGGGEREGDQPTDERALRRARSRRRLRRRRALLLVAAAICAALAAWLLVDRGAGTKQSRAAVSGTVPAAPKPAPRPASAPAAPKASSRRRFPAATALGLPPVPPGPLPGYLLIADRDNNRLLIVSPTKHVVWRFPQPGSLKAGESFREPDDAFFTPNYRGISINEEFNQQIAVISIPKRRIIWSYGKAGVAGAGPHELSNPDDAYRLANGETLVADIRNCRVLRLSATGKIVHEIGAAGSCAHDPPRSLLAPNGAVPLPDGGVLVTEIGGYVDRIDANDRLVFSIRTPTTYPSDAQLLPNGDVLVASFTTPGRIDELTPGGRVVWTYGPTAGTGALDRPSLAVRLPNGLIAATDDWHHRVVIIDPRTHRIVWQYGHFGSASAAPGYLDKPDGLDLLPAPTARTQTSSPRDAAMLQVTRIGRLPQPASRLAVLALPDGQILAAGGLVANSSSTQVLRGPPSHLVLVGQLPVPTHDAAAARTGDSIELFGGGESTSTDAVVQIDPSTGATRLAGRLDEPLSDLGAVSIGNAAYLVGGYTGTRYATAILRAQPDGRTTLVARLPDGLRYAGVAVLGNAIYVAGGLTATGESTKVFEVDTQSGVVRVAAQLPAAIAHAPLVALGSSLYLIGGRDPSGAARSSILRIDPASGTVTQAGSLPVALADASAVAAGGRMIVLGGAGRTPSDAVFVVTPQR